jgi:membrane protein DedA with SNARE-associated domain
VDQVLAILRDGTTWVITLGYAGILFATLVEGSGIPLPFPGTFLLAFVGYTAWKGNLDPVQASIAAGAGSTIGAWLLYRVARDAGPMLLAHYGHRLALTQDKLNSADSWFKQHAGRATFFARMTPGARVYISVAAGFARMNQAVFIISTFAGTLLWSSIFVTLGWTLGESWRNASDIIGALQAWILFAVVALLFIAIARRNATRDLKS